MLPEARSGYRNLRYGNHTIYKLDNNNNKNPPGLQYRGLVEVLYEQGALLVKVSKPGVEKDNCNGDTEGSESKL